MANLTFQEEGHIYRLDGVEIPSVTQILKIAGLSNFDNVNLDLLERSIRFGIAVHKVIELKCKGTLDESSVGEALIPYAKQWDNFCLDYQYFSSQVEYRAFNHALRVGFCIDNIGSIDEAITIVDIKTGAVKASDIIQACAYGYLYPAKRLIVLYLCEDKYKILDIKGQERRKGESIFLSALALYNFKKEKGLL